MRKRIAMPDAANVSARPAPWTALPLAAALTACGVGSAPAPEPSCTIDSDFEPSAGLPDGFDLASFRDEIAPALASSCGDGGCHAPAAESGGFAIWPGASTGGCDLAQSFNSFRPFAGDLAANSRILLAIDGTFAEHPVSVPAGSVQPELLESLRELIRDANLRKPDRRYAPGGNPFDYDAFRDDIMPRLEGAGCAGAGCHDLETRPNQFGLHRDAEPESLEMEANFGAVVSRLDAEDPLRSQVYLRATEQHAGGDSVVLDGDDASALLAWIEDGSQSGPAGCADISGFNLGVWDDEIMPILSGDLDLNTGGAGSGPMCTSGPCHGTERVADSGEAGVLLLDPDRDPLENLRNFACFVNFENPVRSEILLCPLDRRGCRFEEHPGEDIFADTGDLNYQRLLAFIYSGNPRASPLDFAFFAERINPIFDNPAATASGTTCASNSCHGVAFAGQTPPNASNFPLLRHASERDELTVNFANAAAFASFLTPEESSLFLYPTNEIRRVFGFSHIGGTAFEPDSAFAEDILTWARGLRPDADGFIRSWLVAGDYPGADDVRDATSAGDEETLAPRIFDDSGGRREDTWEGLFAESPAIDLDERFPRDVSPGRAAYAVAYVMNADSRAVDATLRIESPHDTLLYFGDQRQPSSAGAATITRILEPFAGSGELHRIVVKVFQAEGEPGPGFEFTARLTDEDGDPLTDDSSEIIFVLGPEGGV